MSVQVAVPRRMLTRLIGALVVAALVAFGPQCAEAAAPDRQAAMSTPSSGLATLEAVSPDGGLHAGPHHGDGDGATKNLLSACLSLLLVILVGVAGRLVRRLLLRARPRIVSSRRLRQSRTIWLPVPPPVTLGIARI